MRVILSLLIALSLYAGNCEYYKSEAVRYEQEAKKQQSYEMQRRYYDIAQKYWYQYRQCIMNETKQMPYQGYR